MALVSGQGEAGTCPLPSMDSNHLGMAQPLGQGTQKTIWLKLGPHNGLQEIQ